MNICKKELQKGVYLACCKTDKFKSALMTVSFAVPLQRETASGYSLLTNLLSLSTGSYPTMQSFSIIKDELYALGLDSYVQRRGEILLVRLEINTIADSFAFDNEKVLFRATELLGDAIFNPNLVNGSFPERAVETEKDCLIEEIESEIESKPSFALLRARQIMCEGEPFAVDAAGEIELVERLDGVQLTEFYNEIIKNAPVYICYTGEADFDYVLDCVNKNLPFSPRETKLPSPVFHQKREKELFVTETVEMEQSILVLGLTLDEIPKNAKERAVLTVYDEIFGGSPASKLFMNVREKEGLCYFCSSYPTAKKNILFVSCGLEPGMEEKAKNAIYRETEAMKKGDFSENDLQNAKSSIKRSLQSVESSLGSLNGYLFSLIFSEENVTQEETIKLVEAVTREEVVAFAKTVNPELVYILGAEA